MYDALCATWQVRAILERSEALSESEHARTMFNGFVVDDDGVAPQRASFGIVHCLAADSSAKRWLSRRASWVRLEPAARRVQSAPVRYRQCAHCGCRQRKIAPPPTEWLSISPQFVESERAQWLWDATKGLYWIWRRIRAIRQWIRSQQYHRIYGRIAVLLRRFAVSDPLDTLEQALQLYEKALADTAVCQCSGYR